MTIISTFLSGKSGKQSWDNCACGICNIEYQQRSCITKERRLNKLSDGKDICIPCAKHLNITNIVKAGTISLKSRSTEDKILHASIGGLASSTSSIYNSSKFSTERWNAKTNEEKAIQVKRASDGLQEKLKDIDFSTKHFIKVLAQKQLGYMSKGHIELHDTIKDFGFISHYQISNMQVDECNIDLKLVIEYNGDMWHCNPNKWKSDDFNSAIKMTAGQKWCKDIARHAMLNKFGYKVLVIWESDWLENQSLQFNRIKDIL